MKYDTIFFFFFFFFFFNTWVMHFTSTFVELILNPFEILTPMSHFGTHIKINTHIQSMVAKRVLTNQANIHTPM